MAVTLARRLDAEARVIVFVDGQNVYKSCKDHFGYGYCHPILLARELAGNRRLVGLRYYSGVHDSNVNPLVHAAIDRRHKLIGRTGASVIERQLAYRWEWGYDPGSFKLDPRKHQGVTKQVDVAPYKKAREKGIDVALALDVVDLAIDESVRMDVAIVISEDGDLTEAARVVHRMTGSGRRVSVEAAVVNGRKKKGKPVPVVLEHYDYTHQVDRDVFDRCRDDFDYKSGPLDKTLASAWLASIRSGAAPGCI